MRRIRVLHTLCRIHSGGVEQLRILLAKLLDPDLYEHELICQDSAGPIPDILRDSGWTIHEIGLAPGILNPAWHSRAYDIARNFQPDIVHGAVYEGEALACGIGIRMPRAKVVLEETSDPVDRRWTGNALMRAMCMRADACIGVSPKVTEYLHDILRIPDRKIHLINNAVPESEAPSVQRLTELRESLGISKNDVIIGSVGRIQDDHKRFSDIIRAIPIIRRKYPRVKLLIVGDGPDRSKLEALSLSLAVSDAVIFSGYQGNPRNYYYLMDVFVLASAREAFGLVLVEAMLSGVPVVATNVGGIPFVLDGGKAGVLVPPAHPEELANAIIRLLVDQNSAAAYRVAGFERASSAFSPTRYVAEIEQLYRKLLNKPHAL